MNARHLALAGLLLLTGCRHAVIGSASNPVTWFSLPSDEPERAAQFYRQAFGWGVEPLAREPDAIYDYTVVVNSPGDASYTPSTAGRVNGCIVKRATGITTPAVLIEVPSLEAAKRRVLAAGGSVVSPGPVPMRSLGGSFLLVKDPEGNLLELFESAR